MPWLPFSAHGDEQQDREGDERRASVAHKRQRNAHHGHQADGHAHVDQHVEQQAVSYTHLDVYKRQVLCPPRPAETAQRRTAGTLIGQQPFAPGVGKMCIRDRIMGLPSPALPEAGVFWAAPDCAQADKVV